MTPELQQSGVFILAIFLAIMAERGWQWLRRRKARNWPVVQGRIHSADWRQPRTGTNRYFLANISYYYFVAGHFYAGYHRRSFSNSVAASEWVKHMLGASIEVRYHPETPETSLLLGVDLLSHDAPAGELAREA